MDVLSSMKEIPVITGYKQDGVIVMDFDPMEELESYTPVIEMLPGWECDISGCRKFEDLPEAARSYVEYVEKAIGCPIGYVSVGAERESLILR